MLHPVLAAERQAVIACLANSVRLLGEVMPAIAGGANGETLHQFRVELRRIRTLLRAFDVALPLPGISRLVEDCRWLARAGSAVRDSEVFLQGLPEYLDPASAQEVIPARLLAQELRRICSRERRVLLRAVRSKRAQALLERLQAATALSPLVPGWPAQAIAARALRKSMRKVVKLARAIDADTPAEQLHDLRKRCKALRYLLDMYAPVDSSRDAARLATRLRKLQNALGEFQDQATHTSTLEQLRAQTASAGHDPAWPALLERVLERLRERAVGSQARAIGRLAALRACKSRKRVARNLKRSLRLQRPLVGTGGYCHGFADGSAVALPVGKIVCVGRNYAAHAAELGNPVEAQPLLFIKPPSAAVDLAPQLRVPQGQGSVHHEIEIALLIGRELRDATPEQARAAIAGIGLGLDLTLRDAQDRLKAKGQPWEIAKGFDGAAALGPFRPLDPELDLAALELRLAVNGRRRQAGSSAEMLTSILALLCFASARFSLWPGDVLLTGTPKGVGELKPGDRLSAELVGLSRLRATVVA